MIRVAVSKVHASDNLLDYLQRLVAYTRQSPEFEVGLSPRGALALLDCAKTWAAMHNRGHVVPEDVQMVLPAVASHRLVPSGDYAGDGDALVDLLQRNVDVIGPERSSCECYLQFRASEYAPDAGVPVSAMG